MGADAVPLLTQDARLVWEVEADSHFEAMTAYSGHMNWGMYTTDQEWDHQPYPEGWRSLKGES